MAAAGGLGWVGAHRGWAAAEAMARVGSGSEEVASSRPQEQGAEEWEGEERYCKGLARIHCALLGLETAQKAIASLSSK